MTDEKSVWTEYISEHRARRVARALKGAGYASATIAKCRGHVIGIAQYFEPGDAVARHQLINTICQAAEIQPR